LCVDDEEHPISHQQFVDDNMLMAQSTAREAKAQSQFFFFHTTSVVQAHIYRILGFQRISLPSKYIGSFSLKTDDEIHHGMTSSPE
jgi:hypothetical protein